MADDAYGATIAKRILSQRLVRFRIATGFTPNQVCALLNWRRGKLAHIEANLRTTPEWGDVRDLLDLYDVTSIDRDEIQELTMMARARGWWRDFPDIFDNEFPGYENDAVTICTVAPVTLPALLQTRDHVEALLREEFRPPAWRRRAVRARIRRQEILDGSRSIVLSAVITEASLMHSWGTPGDHREQVEHLIDMARRSNVRLQIQHSEDVLPVGTSKTVHIFGFDGAHRDLVFMETDRSIKEIKNEETASEFVNSFRDACKSALDPDDTLRYLTHLTKGSHFGPQRIILSSSPRLGPEESSRDEDHATTPTSAGVSPCGQPEPAEPVTGLDENRISVVAYVDGGHFAMRKTLERVDKLVRALGYGNPINEEVQLGSIFRKYFALMRRGFSSSEVQERAIKAERALELLTIDSMQAQVDTQSAMALQNLVSSLSEIPTACIRAGSIFLIKYNKSDGPVIVARTLSQVEIRILELYPEIQLKPEKALEALAAAKDESTPPFI